MSWDLKKSKRCASKDGVKPSTLRLKMQIMDFQPSKMSFRIVPVPLILASYFKAFYNVCWSKVQFIVTLVWIPMYIPMSKKKSLPIL